jgi:hypothetical protein
MFTVIFYTFLALEALDPDGIRIWIGIQPKVPDSDEMNADPQPWFLLRYGTHCWSVTDMSDMIICLIDL